MEIEEMRGKGIDSSDPVRRVRQWWTTDGLFIGEEYDEYREASHV